MNPTTTEVPFGALAETEPANKALIQEIGAEAIAGAERTAIPVEDRSDQATVIEVHAS